MGLPEPTLEVTEACRVPAEWDQILDKARRGESRILLKEAGVAVAALVSAHDLEQLRWLDEQRRRDLAILEAFSAPFKDETPEEIERQVAKAVAAARAKTRRSSKRASARP